MRVELESAVSFIISMLRAGHRAKLVRSNDDKFFLEPEIEMLQLSLFTVMSNHYKDFWFPESPNRGSAYRCIRINKDKMDPIIAKAAASCGLSCNLIRSYLPEELTLWVDPAEVSYRIGEEDGSICVLYEGPVDGGAIPLPQIHYEGSFVTTGISPGSLTSSPLYNTHFFHLPQQQQHLQQQHFHQQQQRHFQQQQQQQQHHLKPRITASVMAAAVEIGNAAYPNSYPKSTRVFTFLQTPPQFGPATVQILRSSPYQTYSSYISS